MMRYATIPWPLAGLFVAVALVGQETLLAALGTNPSLAQTAYRMLVWTVGATSLALPAAAAATGVSPLGFRLRRPRLGLGRCGCNTASTPRAPPVACFSGSP
jgi:hypothetical protein